MVVPASPDQESKMPMRLYRVMCEGEFRSLTRTGRFTTAPGTVEGKWFAECIEHAVQWGKWFERAEGILHRRIVEVTLSAAAIEHMIRYPRLDGIGPAVFATLHQLRGVKFREVRV